MRYSKFALLFVMSVLLGLTSITAAQAASKNFGRLTQTSNWKIGTVNTADNKTYCAMVNKFDDDTVLAFSKDDKGNESIAIDLMKGLLVPGVEYSFILHSGRTRRSVVGQSNSEKSIVLALQDEGILGELEKGKRLRVSSTPFEAIFDIKKFLQSYAVLLDCASGLRENDGPRVKAVPVNRVERSRDDVSPRYNTLKEEFEFELKQQLSDSKDRIAFLSKQQEELRYQLKNQKSKVRTFKTQQEDHMLAQKTMARAIEKKDEEIAKLLLKQKENNALIEKLTLEKKQVVKNEKLVESKQKNLMELLLTQKGKVVEFETKYKAQEQAKVELAKLLERKKIEIQNINKEHMTKSGRVINDLNEKYQTQEKANQKLKALLDSKKEEFEVANKKHSSESEKVINDLISKYKAQKKDNQELRSLLESKKKDAVRISKERAAESEQVIEKFVSRYKEQNKSNQELKSLLESKKEEAARISSKQSAKSAEVIKDLENKYRNQEKANRELRSLLDKKEIAADRDRRAQGAKSAKIIRELEDRYREQEDAKRNLKRALENKEIEAENLSRKQSLESEEIIRDLEGQKRSLSSQLKKLKYKNTRLEGTMADLRSELRKSEDMLFKNSQVDMTEVLAHHKQKIAMLEKRYEDQELVKQELQELLSQKEDEILRARRDNRSTSDVKISGLQKREQRLSDRVDELKRDNRKLRSEIDRARTSYKEAVGFSPKVEDTGSAEIIQAQKEKLLELTKRYKEQKNSQMDLQRKLELKEIKISGLKQASVSNKNRLIDDMVSREQKLARRISGLGEENERLQSEIELARRALHEAGLVDANETNVDFSSVLKQQLKKSAETARSFSDAKEIYENKLSDLEAERNEFKAKLELLSLEKETFAVEAESAGRHANLSKKQVAEIKNRMMSMAQQREDTSKTLVSQKRHNRILEAALEAKAQELKQMQRSASGEADRLISVQDELDQLKKEKNTLVEKLQDELKEKTVQYDVLKKQFDKRIGFIAVDKKLLSEIDLKKETLVHVEKQIKTNDVKKHQMISELAKYRKELTRKKAEFMSASETKYKTAKSNIDRLSAEKEKLQRDLPVARKNLKKLKRSLNDVVKEEAPISLIAGNNSGKEVQSFVKNKMSNLEIQLASAGQQKQELSDLVDKRRKEFEEEVRLLEIKKDNLVKTGKTNLQHEVDIERINTNIKKVQKDKEIAMNVLNGKLKDKNAEYKALEKEFDKQSDILPQANKLERELSLAESKIKKMEARFVKADENLKKAMALVKLDNKKIPAEKLAILKAIEDKIVDNERLIQKAALDHETNINKREYLQEEIAELHVKFDENVAKTAPLKVRKKALEKDLTVARKRISKLEFEVDEANKKKQQLADKINSQNEVVKELQTQVAETSKAVPLNFRKTVELTIKQEEIDRLERDLTVVRTQYKLAMDEVAVAQDKIADMSQQKSIDAQGYKQQHYAVQAELYEVKKNLTDLEAEMSPVALGKNRAQAELAVTKARLSELEGELISVAQEKQSLSIQLEEQIQQNHSLQDALAANEQEVFDLKHALDETNRRLAEVQGSMDTLKPEYASVVNDLVLQLKSKITQYDDLQNMFDTQMKSMPVLVDVEAELESNKDSLEALELELIRVNAERRRAEENAIRSKAELEKSLIQIDALRGNLSSTTEKSSQIRKVANDRRRQLEKVADKEVLEKARMNMDKRQRADELKRKRRAAAVQFQSTKAAKDAAKPRISSKAAKKTISKAETFLNRMMAKHRSGMSGEPIASSAGRKYSPKRAVKGAALSRINKKVNLRSLLKNTGLSVSNFATVEQNADNVVSQWNADRMSGMYEQMGSTGDFQSQVDNYIKRYRADCSEGLKARVTPARQTKVGAMATADLECNMSANSYANSIVFLDDKSGFSAVVHTSYPEEKASVRNARDSIIRTLERSKGFAAPRVIKQVETTQQYKFNIPAGDVEEDENDGIETIVIQ